VIAPTVLNPSLSAGAGHAAGIGHDESSHS
jgi:hypothetical protein